MRKHIYLMLIILMPIFAQKSKWKIAESKQIVVPEKSISETNSTSVPRRISYQGFLTNENGQPANDMLYNINSPPVKISTGNVIYVSVTKEKSEALLQCYFLKKIQYIRVYKNPSM